MVVLSAFDLFGVGLRSLWFGFPWLRVRRFGALWYRLAEFGVRVFVVVGAALRRLSV